MFLYCQVYIRRTNIVCPIKLSQYIEGHESTFDCEIDRGLCPFMLLEVYYESKSKNCSN